MGEVPFFEWPPSMVRLAEWWRATRDKQWLQEHPVVGKHQWQSRAIPIRIFGDGVAVLGLAKSWGRSIDIIAVAPILVKAKSQTSHIISSMVWKKGRNAETKQMMWSILAWSLRHLFEGVHPDRDWLGNAFPAGSIMESLAGRPLAAGFLEWWWCTRAAKNWRNKTNCRCALQENNLFMFLLLVCALLETDVCSEAYFWKFLDWM